MLLLVLTHFALACHSLSIGSDNGMGKPPAPSSVAERFSIRKRVRNAETFESSSLIPKQYPERLGHCGRRSRPHGIQICPSTIYKKVAISNRLGYRVTAINISKVAQLALERAYPAISVPSPHVSILFSIRHNQLGVKVLVIILILLSLPTWKSYAIHRHVTLTAPHLLAGWEWTSIAPKICTEYAAPVPQGLAALPIGARPHPVHGIHSSFPF